MKTNEYVKDLNTKSVDELTQALVEAKKELFNLRFQNATNQLENTSRIKEVRKNIARIQTVKLKRLTLLNNLAEKGDYCRGRKKS